jgi:F-type H+-transporting ATPase subunit epsilon
MCLTSSANFVLPLHRFNRYAAIAARTLRRALKEDKRVAVERLDFIETKAATWAHGKREY